MSRGTREYIQRDNFLGLSYSSIAQRRDTSLDPNHIAFKSYLLVTKNPGMVIITNAGGDLILELSQVRMIGLK